MKQIVLYFFILWIFQVGEHYLVLHNWFQLPHLGYLQKQLLFKFSLTRNYIIVTLVITHRNQDFKLCLSIFHNTTKVLQQLSRRFSQIDTAFWSFFFCGETKTTSYLETGFCVSKYNYTFKFAIRKDIGALMKLR